MFVMAWCQLILSKTSSFNPNNTSATLKNMGKKMKLFLHDRRNYYNIAYARYPYFEASGRIAYYRDHSEFP